MRIKLGVNPLWGSFKATSFGGGFAAQFYFIASFAAFHYGLMAFGINFLTLPFVVVIPMLPKILMLVFGACGLISLLSMFTGCKECK